MNKVSQNHIHARSADGELFILSFNSVQDLFRFSACIRGVKVSHVVVRFENMNRAEDSFLGYVSKSTTFDVSPAYDFPLADELALENTVTALIKLSPISTLRTTSKSTGRSLAMSRLRTIFIYCSMYLFNLL